MSNGRLIKNPKDMANVMNNHFCTVGKKLQDNMPNNDPDAFKDYLPQRTLESFFISPIDVREIINEIKKLNPKKATGPDGIGAKIIQLVPETFALNLVKIYNKSIELGEYPTDMKIARVIALFKKG